MTGTEGWAAAADGYTKPDVSSPALLGEFNRVISQYVARTGRSLDHMQNFLDCVRSRERTVANPEVMHHSMTTVHAANICMWLKRSLKFDPVKEEFVGDDEANRLRSRAMREPYIYLAVKWNEFIGPNACYLPFRQREFTTMWKSNIKRYLVLAAALLATTAAPASRPGGRTARGASLGRPVAG